MKVSELSRIQPGVASSNVDTVVPAIKELFTYSAPDESQMAAMQRVRDYLAEAYFVIVDAVPCSPARTRALNNLTDARMLANQAIMFKGEV